MRLFILFLGFSCAAGAANFRVCEDAKVVTELVAEGFKYRTNRIASNFKARHSLNDSIAVFGQNAALEGKFTYGILARNLKNEPVEVWVDLCKGHFVLLERLLTDNSGMLRFALPTALLKEPGQYRVWMRVPGDGTGAFSTLRIVAPGTKAAVFDVDGTLTAHETDVTLSIISELIKGCFSPPMRPSGPELTRYLRDTGGYEIIYLSGRHHFMNDMTRKWLMENKFAPGTLMVTQSLTEVLPKETSVGHFKHAQLGKIKESGLFIARAYGNARTDVVAYKKAGVSEHRIFTVGLLANQLGAVGIGYDFTKHYQELSGGSGAPR